MHANRPGITRFVHIGLVVEDLDETVRFLSLLGFDCGTPGVFSGEWIDRIIGIEDVTVEVVMARGPHGGEGGGGDGSWPRGRRGVRGGPLPVAVRRRARAGAGREPSWTPAHRLHRR